MKLSVFGGGSWGTAMAHQLARRGHEVVLWARETEVAEGINADHRNPLFISDLDLHPGIEAIKREIMEETGYKVDTVNHLQDFYTCPSRLDEIISVFYVEVSEKVNEGGGIGDENISIVEAEMLGLGGRLFFEDPMNMEMKVGEEHKMKPPYQLIDAKSLIAVMSLENSNVLRDMADVITQAKLRSL